jgi:dihydrofolate reductase
MRSVIWDVSMSVDGFIAGPEISMADPLGRDGDQLHEWMRGGEPGHGVAVVDELHASAGAVIMGRRTYDTGIGPWADVPLPVPCFVLTHRPHPPLQQARGTFTFVTDGIEAALEQASTAAGEHIILLMGAETGQQYLTAELVDELHIHLAPVLLGAGARLYNPGPGQLITLEHARTSDDPGVTHIRYRVSRPTPQ